MLVSTIIFTLSLLGYISYSFIAMGAVMAYVAFFEIGLGPIPWLIVAEMFDSKYVATAMSLSCIVNWVCNFLVGLLFPYMQEYFGPWSFGPFAIVLLLTVLFAYIYLPETHGRSVAEIQRLVGANDEELIHMIENIQGVEDDGLVFGELDYSSDGDIGAGRATTTTTTSGGSSRGISGMRYAHRGLGERDSSTERLSRDSFQEM
jgi:MFS family permease